MATQDESPPQEAVNENKEKLVYSPPVLIVIGIMKDVQSKLLGISEGLCGCGIFS